MENNSEFLFWKMAIAGLFAFVVGSCSACGASLSRDTVIGTTSYLEVHNQRYSSHGGTMHEEHTEEEKRELGAMIGRAY